MDRVPAQRATLSADTPDDDLLADVDEPPEQQFRAPFLTQLHAAFGKADTQMFSRRESLLTRQLHSETEFPPDDRIARPPPRALSTQSTWSNPSVTSTAELTSDDGHSVASPGISPPLPPTTLTPMARITDEFLSKEPQILGHDEKLPDVDVEKTVEAGLGRKRCISFACGNKAKVPPPAQPPAATPQSSASPPKRKCALRFVCPTRSVAESKISGKPSGNTKKPASPPPLETRPVAKFEGTKTHRGSDSTVTHASPKILYKVPAVIETAPTPTSATLPSMPQRRLSDDSVRSTEATRFHEFATSDDEPEEWVQEATCHRSRLTVSDTLQKENVIRKACQEVEDEVFQEEEENEEEEDLDDLGLEDVASDDNDNDDDIEDEQDSDEGFRTDDEEGFAESDSENEESDEEWWRPGGPSTAATSVDQLERLAFTARENATLSSSVGSISSAGHPSPIRLVPAKMSHRKRSTGPMPRQRRCEPRDLPDSTDFVCGTLDEDRPLEQAYLNHLKQKEAAKHKARPQDIDPTFPTSDPDMDEEDDEDLVTPEESEHERFMHGDLDELGDEHTLRDRSVSKPRIRSRVHRSPPPPARRRASPAPTIIRRQIAAHSPPPSKRIAAGSPAPRRLFAQSPVRSRSPAPTRRLPSPPNTRRVSPARRTDTVISIPHVLASRPQLTHTASLPRGGFVLGKVNSLRDDNDEGSDTVGNNVTGEKTKRGAIDIFKGLEKKRQRRKEKLYQKACAKAAAKGERPYKVKPGRGAERMREVAMGLQLYHGKGAHILSL